MSLGIGTVTSEGIVLAADSRQTYRNLKGAARIGSDSASKIFMLNQRVGVAVAGLAFLPQNEVLRNISQFVEDFKSEIEPNATITTIASKLKKFFDKAYKHQAQLKILAEQMQADIMRQGGSVIDVKEEVGHVKITLTDSNGVQGELIGAVEQLQFIVAGYNPDGSHEIVLVYIPGSIEHKRNSKKPGLEYGASWIGQVDVVTRIVLGFDARIVNLPIMRESLSTIGLEGMQSQLAGLEYVIQWGTMTLQDGIDFSTLAIETTTAIQRFSDGIAADPGDIPGVGGPIDIAVITPDDGFRWIAKKNVKVGGEEVLPIT
jgi:hypothetical protein